MRRIAKRLDELGVPYAVVGGMALFQHGFRRADVPEVIKVLSLPIEFAEQLNPYVREKFRGLWSPAETVEPLWSLVTKLVTASRWLRPLRVVQTGLRTKSCFDVSHERDNLWITGRL